METKKKILTNVIVISALELLLIHSGLYITIYLEGTKSWDVIAFTGGVLFVFHHVTNMVDIGFSTLFCLNVFLIGVAFYLLVKLTNSFWICCGVHTG